MKVELEIVDCTDYKQCNETGIYYPSGFSFEDSPDSIIVSTIEDNAFSIIANKEGLEVLAKNILCLAQGTYNDQYDIEFADWCLLQPNSEYFEIQLDSSPEYYQQFCK